MTLRPVPEARGAHGEPAGRAHGELVPVTSAASAGLTAAGGARPAPRRAWTGQDFVWWNTAAVLTTLRTGRRPNPVSPVVDPVRRALAADEVMLATCDAELLVWRRGDAVYNPSRGFFLAGGAAGLALTAAFFGGRAYLDSRRRRAAEADSVERWRHLADARLTVSTDGIYLGTGEGVMPIAFRDVQEARLTGTGEIVMAASNANGSARWKLRAQWSELVLVLWAGRYMPEHPQIVGRTWLPGDWLIHAAAHGYDVDTSAWPRLTPRALR